MAETAEFGPRKTIFILAIVAGCFAVLWPKIFYPLLTASVNPHHPPTESTACCDVIFESDINTVDILQEMCQNILRHHQIDPRVRDALKVNKLTPQSASLCREEVLARCGIDLSSFLAERERLGKSYKQVLEEIRSFNSSLCLKMNFGVPLSQLGMPHLIRYHILMPHSTVKQERRTPPHAGGLHPAMRERGRAIPSSHIVPKVEDRPEQVAIPKMRPPLGGAGHVVPAPKGNSTMGIIMPLYTLGIILFFVYTIVKVVKKNSDSEIISEFPNIGAEAEKEFRKMVFSPDVFATAMTGSLQYRKERSASPLRPAPTIEELKDLVDEAPKFNGLAGIGPSLKEDTVDKELSSKEDTELEEIEESSPTVKVVGMEMTAACEGGQRGSRPTTPLTPVSHSHVEREKTPPRPIYLEGALPPQCELLVTDSETQAEKPEEDVEAPVVLSGKMTLSLISLDQIAAETDDNGLQEPCQFDKHEHELEEYGDKGETSEEEEVQEENKKSEGSSDDSDDEDTTEESDSEENDVLDAEEKVAEQHSDINAREENTKITENQSLLQNHYKSENSSENDESEEEQDVEDESVEETSEEEEEGEEERVVGVEENDEEEEEEEEENEDNEREDEGEAEDEDEDEDEDEGDEDQDSDEEDEEEDEDEDEDSEKV
ncbi:uncharacterized protein LOC111673866 isoform X2 [Orussus abietinus]|uniref:uncharacterized protein LOC111673866 isoform X2 n=1 Tax=Orussus abietinus TaxID=222816 RepID=UPI000C7162CF|nr:uncharacterized protein LOC111673866 isoform X2 [Orussus abietinus]